MHCGWVGVGWECTNQRQNSGSASSLYSYKQSETKKKYYAFKHINRVINQMLSYLTLNMCNDMYRSDVIINNYI